jgi:ferritin heavy chain
MAKVSAVRQNFHDETETAINNQINLELTASYTYQSMAFYFDRDDVALPGFSEFFSHNSEEEREHAEKFMKLQSEVTATGKSTLANLHKFVGQERPSRDGEMQP